MKPSFKAKNLQIGSTVTDWRAPRGLLSFLREKKKVYHPATPPSLTATSALDAPRDPCRRTVVGDQPPYNCAAQTQKVARGVFTLPLGGHGPLPLENLGLRRASSSFLLPPSYAMNLVAACIVLLLLVSSISGASMSAMDGRIGSSDVVHSQTLPLHALGGSERLVRDGSDLSMRLSGEERGEMAIEGAMEGLGNSLFEMTSQRYAKRSVGN